MKILARRPRIAPYAVSFALLTASCGREVPYRHVVLISLDTTRADHLGCYGNRVVETPSIDALAREGVLFESVTCASPSTLASHTSIMTGLYPHRHGVVRNGFMVSEENVMLAEVLREEGFHTAGFLGAFALDRVFEFNQGFEHFDQGFDIEFRRGGADQDQRRAEAVTDAVLSHLDELGGGERLFLFAHYFDPHTPYDPPPPFDRRYARDGGPVSSNMSDVKRQEQAHQTHVIGQTRNVFRKGLTAELVRAGSGGPLPGDEDLAALYAGEISYLDHHLGRLFEGLRKRGVLEDAIVILTGDHGETFWEHADFWRHGAWVYETNVGVPLIVTLPGGQGRGVRVSEPISTTDIYPTLLDLLEIPIPEPVDGRSLAGVFEGAELPARPVFSEASQPIRLEAGQEWGNQRKPKCVRSGDYKLVVAPYLGLQELYDLSADPDERVDLLRNPTPHSQNDLPALREALRSWRQSRDPRPSHYNSAQLDEVRRRLGNLGYTGGAEGEKGS